MRSFYKDCLPAVCFLGCVAFATAQQTQTAAAVTAVPRLIRFTGSFHPPVSQPAGMTGATFAIYGQQEGGTPLWSEEQNVEMDANGNYTVLLGSTNNEGVPVELFAAGESRWLQVKFYVPGEVDLPQVLLVSVPYALKAGDADTLGGKPASAYLLAGAATSAQPEGPFVAAPPAQPEATVSAPTAAGVKPRLASTGSTNYIAKFTDTAGDVGNSVMYQSGSNIGIGTTSPGQLLTLQTGATGYTFLENLYGSVDPGNGATRLEVGNPVSTLMLTAYGSKAPGILGGSAGVVSLAGPLLVGNAAANAPLYLYAGNKYTAPQFTLTSTGSVGIGTQTPAATLEVKGSAQVDGNLTLSGSILSPSSSVPVIQAPNNGSFNFSAGLGSLPLGTTGTGDTAVGDNVLEYNTTGVENTAIGYQALLFNTTGLANTASGAGALYANTTGGYNAAHGYSALGSNTTGGSNTASGASALAANTIGVANTASGYQALNANTTGNSNTASGSNALYANTAGNNNTASGWAALYSNTTGSENTAAGEYALYSNTTGSFNTASGYQALNSNTAGLNNIAVGSTAGVNITASNNIDIGNRGTATDSGAIRIGTAGTQTTAFIAGIYGVTTSASNAVPVLIDSNGNLGTISSSRRYKEDIQDMGDTSSGLMRLRPVTFRYKKLFDDGSKPIQYGLIAEEVAEVYPDLVARSADGQIETVKYQLLDSMLLNEVQKQNATIAVQKEQIRDQAQQIRALEERLARVEAALSGTTVTASTR